MNKTAIYVTAGVLAAIGLAIFLTKWLSLGFPVRPDSSTQVWTVEAQVHFEARPGPTKVDLLIPRNPPGFVLLNENFVSKGYGLSTQPAGENRVAQWSIRRASGPQTLYYRAVVYRDDRESAAGPQPPYPPVPELREPYQTALTALVEDARSQSADVATFATAVLNMLNRPARPDYVDIFLEGDTSPANKANVAVTLLAGARIPARVVHGILLTEQQREATFVPYLEVHNGSRWVAFDPVTANPGLPANYLVWWRGHEAIVSGDGARLPRVEVSLYRNLADAIAIAQRRAEMLNSRLVQFSLLSLPVQTQTVYSILLLVPVGAFLILLFRNLVGVRTFGTFMPVLVALAFRETQLIWGIVLFTVVVGLGLSVRFYLEHLRLLLVPRLTAVLTVVVLLLLMISIISHRLGMETGLSIALFPMVIMTMVIERMSISWEERGARQAMNEALGTLVVATIAYLVISIDEIQHLVFVFPELLLVLLAASLVLGRYSGYRLTELTRFRALAQQSGGETKP